MHTIYTCTQGKIEPVNIGNFIPRIQQYGQHLSPRHYQGPTPYIPKRQGIKRNILTTYQKGLLTFDANPAMLYSINLLSCVSVIYTSTDIRAQACAHVHHANCGTLEPTDIYQAIQSLYPDNSIYPPDPSKIYVVYAHPTSNVLYGDEIKKLLECGILLDNIVEIEELPTGSFGIDNNGYIGCVD